MGQESTEEKKKLRGGLMSTADERELNDWKTLKVFQPFNGFTPSKLTVDARRALTWKLADGEKDVEARWVATGYQKLYPKDGSADTYFCVSLRSSHIRAAPLGPP